MKILVNIIILIISLTILFKISNVTEYVYDKKIIEILDLTNSERTNPLKIDKCLSDQAVERAKFLIRINEFNHYTSDGTTPWKFIKKCGRYDHAGENLAKYFTNNNKMYNAWMNSENHRKNILNENFEKIGIGCYENICVQFFTEK